MVIACNASSGVASPLMAESEAARADLDAEFKDFLVKLRADLRKARRDELAILAAQGTLSAEAAAEYRDLLRGST